MKKKTTWTSIKYENLLVFLQQIFIIHNKVVIYQVVCMPWLRSGFWYLCSSHSIRKWFSDLCNTNWWCTKICSNNPFCGPFILLSVSLCELLLLFLTGCIGYTITRQRTKNGKFREKNEKRVAVNKPPWNIWIIIKFFFFRKICYKPFNLFGFSSC